MKHSKITRLLAALLQGIVIFAAISLLASILITAYAISLDSKNRSAASDFKRHEPTPSRP